MASMHPTSHLDDCHSQLAPAHLEGPMLGQPMAKLLCPPPLLLFLFDTLWMPYNVEMCCWFIVGMYLGYAVFQPQLPWLAFLFVVLVLSYVCIHSTP
jgi:hypothetical protein